MGQAEQALEIDADLPPTRATVTLDAQVTPGGLSLAWSASGVRGLIVGSPADVQAAVGALVMRLLGHTVDVVEDVKVTYGTIAVGRFDATIPVDVIDQVHILDGTVNQVG